MSATEIVPSEVEGNGSFQVVQLFAESVRKPRKAAKLHSHREILAFNMTGTDMSGIGATIADFGYNLRDSWWGVPFIAVLPIVAEQLDELREIHGSAEHILDTAFVEMKAICCKLESGMSQSALQIAQESETKMNKVVNKSFVHDGNKINNWDDLIALAEKNVLRAKIRQEELTAAIRVYQKKRDAGLPLVESELAS